MRSTRTSIRHTSLALLVSCLGLTACGNGVPIQLRIDDFVTTIDMGATTTLLEAALHGTGLLPPQAGIPEIWPNSLPRVTYTQSLLSPPLRVEIPPSDPAQAKKYADILKYRNAIVRIEFNELVMRFEQNTLNIDLPALTLQAADKSTANPDDRKAWLNIGTVPITPGGQVVDQAFIFADGGESFLDDQLAKNPIQFAIRTNGLFVFDTAVNGNRPSGKAVIRVIIVATFFIALDRL
jgi:hypothetical protein